MAGQLPTTHDLATLAIVVVIVAVFAAEVVLSVVRRRRGGPNAPVHAATWAGWVAAACSIAAAVIHLAVIEDHLSEYVPFGIAFALLAIFQLAWPLAYLRRPTRELALVAVAINLGAVVVWMWSRGWGLPIGPAPWVPEAVGPADTISSLLEISLALALLPTLLGRRIKTGAASERSGLQPAVAVLVVGAVAGLATFGALVALVSLSQPA
jgi:hypothetical protein